MRKPTLGCLFAAILAMLTLFGCAYAEVAPLPSTLVYSGQEAPVPDSIPKMAEAPAPPTPEPTIFDRAPEMIDAPITRLINSDHMFDESYMPDDMVYVKNNNPNKIKLKHDKIRANPQALEAFNEMMAAAIEDGVEGFYLICVYRSYDEQKSAWNKKVKRDKNYGKDPNEPVITAYPGASEHQDALAFDITATNARSMSESFKDTPQGIWLANHSYKYGFVLRYPLGKEHITKIVFEPWHFRYLGKELAECLYMTGLTLEEFYGETVSGYRG